MSRKGASDGGLGDKISGSGSLDVENDFPKMSPVNENIQHVPNTAYAKLQAVLITIILL
jgi:hypothetical protein